MRAVSITEHACMMGIEHKVAQVPRGYKTALNNTTLSQKVVTPAPGLSIISQETFGSRELTPFEQSLIQQDYQTDKALSKQSGSLSHFAEFSKQSDGSPKISNINNNAKTMMQSNSHIKTTNHNRMVQALHKQHLGSKFQTQHLQACKDQKGATIDKPISTTKLPDFSNKNIALRKQKNPVLQPTFSQKLLAGAPRFSFVSNSQVASKLNPPTSQQDQLLALAPGQLRGSHHVHFSPESSPRKSLAGVTKTSQSQINANMSSVNQSVQSSYAGYTLANNNAQQKNKTHLHGLTMKTRNGRTSCTNSLEKFPNGEQIISGRGFRNTSSLKTAHAAEVGSKQS